LYFNLKSQQLQIIHLKSQSLSILMLALVHQLIFLLVKHSCIITEL
jgi:hypothetical protein